MQNAAVDFPADGTEEYNKLLRDCYFVKHDEFADVDSENCGRWKCKKCILDILILQKKGTGLSSLVRHVKSKHTDHRTVRKALLFEVLLFFNILY